MQDYSGIDVHRSGSEHAMIRQSGDGRRDEIFVKLSEIDDLVNQLRDVEPGRSSTEKADE